METTNVILASVIKRGLWCEGNPERQLKLSRTVSPTESAKGIRICLRKG